MNIVDPPPLSLKTHKCDPDMSTVTCLAILSSSKKQMVASNNAIYNPQMSHFRRLVRIFQMMAVNSCELCKIFLENKIQKCGKKNSHFVFQVLSLLASLILWKNDRRMFLFSPDVLRPHRFRYNSYLPRTFSPDQFFLSQPTTLCSEYIHF